MREEFWLTNLCRKLGITPRPTGTRRRCAGRNKALPVIEALESRKLLSNGSVTPVGVETQVNTFTTNSQHQPDTAMDANGNYVITWYGYSEDGSNYGVFAQRYNAAGATQGSEFRVNTFTIGTQRTPVVAMDATGDFVIAWVSVGQDYSGAGIYAQRYNAAGVAQGAEFRVNTYTTNAQDAAKIAMDSAGNFVVTWESKGEDGSGYGIYARRFNSAGVALGGEFLVNTGTVNDQLHPDIAMDPSGDFVVSWMQYNTTPFNFFVEARRYNAAGVAQGSPFAVTSGLSALGQPAVAMDSTGDFVVAWAQYIYQSVDPHSYGVYAQRYDSQAAPQGNIFLVNTTLTGAQVNPAVAMDSAGNFVVTWVSNLQDGDQFGVYGQGFNSAGVHQGGEFRVNTFTKNSQQAPQLAIDSKGDVITTWSSYFQDGNGDGIFSQRYKLVAIPPNHAPVGVPKTVTTLEDKPYVFTAGDFGFSDPNDNPANTLLAVNISSLPTAGSLTDNNVAVTLGQSISVTDISQGRLRFTPPANSNGAAVSSFTFQVKDNGGLANGGADTDPTPRKITVSVTSVNDAPVGTVATVTTLEDKAYVFKTSDFGFTDPNDTPANSFLAVKITTLPSVGSLTNNGVAVSAGSSVLTADIAAGKLKFTPPPNKNGAPFFALLNFQVQDNGGTANGGVDTDPTPRRMTITVTPVNDAPVGAAATVTTLEDKVYVFKAADFGFTDPNDSPANTFAAVKVTTLPSVGTLTNNGAAVVAGSVISVTDIAAGKFRYSPPSNKNGAALTSFTFQVRDNGGTANGGIDTDVTPRKMTVAVTSVNDAPIGKAATVTTLEDKAYAFKVADFGFTDPSDVPANSFLSVKITTVPSVGSLTDNGIAVGAGIFIPVADIAAGKLKYTPPLNKNGAALASFTFQVKDNGGTANGGVDTDTVARRMTIAVTSVNDAPVGTAKTVSMVRNTTLTLAVANFGFTDPNDSPANAFLAVKIITLPVLGSLKLNGVAVTANQIIATADISAGKLKYTPPTNSAGTGLGSFTFKVQDNGGTANGGIDLDTTARRLTINVT